MRINILTNTPNLNMISKLQSALIKKRKHVGVFYHEDNLPPALYSPTTLIMVEYGKKLCDAKINRYKNSGGHVFNIHRADPSEYRGASVLNHQILNGDSHISPSIIRVNTNEGFDTGKVYAQERVDITNLIYSEVVDACRETYLNLILSAVRGSIKRNNACSKLCKRRTPSDSELFLSEQDLRIIRASDNDRFPAFFMLGGRKYTLKVESSPL